MIDREEFSQYLIKFPIDKQDAIQKLREIIKNSLPNGFHEKMQYGMPAFVVPHSIYPKGYHCDSSQELPFISFTAQKNFISIYHLGMYIHKEIIDWFVAEYPKHCKTKLDMGKSCIRFKKIDQIPYDLIAELCTKLSVEKWISIYESSLKPTQ